MNDTEFERYVRLYRKSVCTASYCWLKNAGDADDVAQDVFSSSIPADAASRATNRQKHGSYGARSTEARICSARTGTDFLSRSARLTTEYICRRVTRNCLIC